MSSAMSVLTHAAHHHRQIRRGLAESVLRLSTHLARRPAKLVRRRLSVLLKRMNSPLFRYVVSHHALLPAPTRRVADLVVLQGYSLRKAAASAGLSLHRVRQQMQTLRALADAAGQGPAAEVA